MGVEQYSPNQPTPEGNPPTPEDNPEVGFKGAAGALRRSTEELDRLLVIKGALSPEEQKAIDALRDNLTIHGPTL